jgi:hypothetical protein
VLSHHPPALWQPNTNKVLRFEYFQSGWLELPGDFDYAQRYRKGGGPRGVTDFIVKDLTGEG